jgi:hypothetical protein
VSFRGAITAGLGLTACFLGFLTGVFWADANEQINSRAGISLLPADFMYEKTPLKLYSEYVNARKLS